MNESNKKAIIGIAAAIGIGAAATGIAYFAGESQAYVAKVDGTAIKSAEFDKMYVQTKKQYESRFGIDFASEQGKTIEKDLKKGLVDQLIERQVILNEAKKRNIQVTDAQIEEKLAEIKKGFPNDEAFQKAYAASAKSPEAWAEFSSSWLALSEADYQARLRTDGGAA